MLACHTLAHTDLCIVMDQCNRILIAPFFTIPCYQDKAVVEQAGKELLNMMNRGLQRFSRERRWVCWPATPLFSSDPPQTQPPEAEKDKEKPIGGKGGKGSKGASAVGGGASSGGKSSVTTAAMALIKGLDIEPHPDDSIPRLDAEGWMEHLEKALQVSATPLVVFVFINEIST